jgi:hypothetical protein
MVRPDPVFGQAGFGFVSWQPFGAAAKKNRTADRWMIQPVGQD